MTAGSGIADHNINFDLMQSTNSEIHIANHSTKEIHWQRQRQSNVYRKTQSVLKLHQRYQGKADYLVNNVRKVEKRKAGFLLNATQQCAYEQEL